MENSKSNELKKILIGIIVVAVCYFPVMGQSLSYSVNNATFFLNFKNEKVSYRSKEAPNLIHKKLNKSNNETLKLVSTEIDVSGITHEQYQQYYKGIKVEHGIVTVHSQEGIINSINGNLPDINVVATTSLSEQQALQKALDIVDANKYQWQDSAAEARLKKSTSNPNATYYPKGKLVICKNYAPGSKDDEYKLVYKFEIYAKEPLSRSYYYIDAENGSILLEDKLLKHTNAIGTADTRYSGTRSISTELNGGVYYLHDNTRGQGVETYNLDANNNISDFIDNDNNWTAAEYDNANEDNAALDAHWGAMMAYDYWNTVHSRNSFDNNGAKIKSYIHYGAASSLENAFWSGSEILYGGGNNPFSTLDVCGHELGHAITQYTTGLIYSFESGALNEGFSDIWAACVEHYADSTKQTWHIGEEIYPGSYIRSLNNPNSKNQPDTYMGQYWYDGYGDNGGVHINSGVINFWFYLLSKGGNGTNDHAYAYSVTGINMDKAAKIAYQARFYLTPTSQYPDARNATIQAATDLYGVSSNEVLQTKNAWNAVGLYENPLIPPYNLTATITGINTVNLNWNDNNTTLTNFLIERSVSPSIGFAALDTINPATTNYTDTTGITNRVYYYRVRAINDTMISPYSNIVTALLATDTIITMSNSTHTICNAIFMDQGGLGNYNDNTNLVTTFTPTTAGASMVIKFTSFDVDRNYSNDRLMIYDGANTTAPLIGIYRGNFTSNTNFFLPKKVIYASANNPTGQLTFRFVSDVKSNMPGWVAHTSCINLPASTTDLKAIAASATQSTLTWTDNAANETHYLIERSLDLGTSYKFLTSVAANTVSYADTGLPTNSIYYYRIRPCIIQAADTFMGKYSNVAIDTLGYIPFTPMNTGFTQILDWGSSMDWGDYDNDGDLDLLISGYDSIYTKYSIIYNNNNGFFTDINAGLFPLAQGTSKWVDYDNDGDLDCFISGGNNNIYYSILYRNDKGIFTDINAGIQGVISYNFCADWGDYDNDGDMDIAITGYTGSIYITKIYQNSNGIFTDINVGFSGSLNSLKWGDYDNDGDLDLLTQYHISNYYAYIDIWQNSNGNFTRINSGLPRDSLAYYYLNVSWADYDNDGDSDVIFCEYNRSTGKSIIKIYKYTSGRYYDSGVLIPGQYPSICDYDNDGDLDILLIPESSETGTRIYKNTNGIFTNANANVLQLSGRITNYVDYDNDGDLDIFIASNNSAGYFATKIYRNNLIAGTVPPASNANNSPNAPANLTSSISGSTATFHWDKTTDAETPQDGLNYNIRIGTTPASNTISDAVQICSPTSNTLNGYRQVVARGNISAYPQSGNYSINCLDNGTYYWSVQAIDHGYKGSEFAPEQTFTITNARPVIINTIPTNGMVNIDTANNFVLEFSENVTKGSGIIYIREYITNTIVQSYDVASTDVVVNANVVTFPHSNVLLQNTRYYFDIPSTAFINACTNPYSGTVNKNEWNFTTQCTANTVNQTISICQGDTFTTGNSNYTSAGNYTDVFIAQNGCDSTVYTTLMVNQLPAVSIQVFNPAQVCITDGSITLPAVSPTGGTFTGNGIVNNTFDPILAGIGNWIITYSYTDTNGCASTDNTSITVANCNGLDDIRTQNELKVYPNPSEGLFVMEHNNQILSAEVYNIIGEKVLTLVTNQSEKIIIDLRKLGNGIYLLKANSHTGTVSTLKLLKN